MGILFLLVPLICLFILNLPRRGAAAKLAPWVLGVVAVLQMVFAATSHLACWEPFIGFFTLPVPVALVVDPITAVLLFTIALVVAVVTVVGIQGDARDKVITSSLVLTVMAGMNGVVMVRDLFTLYIFLEITALSCFVLIATRKELRSLSAAFRYFILSGLASLAMVLASALVFMQVGSLDFALVAAAINGQDPATMTGLILFVVAFCIKAGAVPFHGWLPEAYSSSSSAISVLLAGATTKVAGVYAIIRLSSEVFAGIPGPAQAFMALGALSIIVGAFAAMGQKEMKRMLAFSSISQLGYIVLAAGLAGAAADVTVSLGGLQTSIAMLAIIGAVVHFVNHALFKSLLFVNAAAVEEQCGTTQLDQLGGLTDRMPVTGWTSVIGFLSTAGLPPFSGFWSKLLIVIALVLANQWVYAVIAILMSLVTLGYFLILQRKVFFGELRKGFEELKEARGALVGTSLILAGLTTALGLLFPFVLLLLQGFGLV
ncbi:MAG: NADH-quinone oxidoreductase subunit L [Coriobacteriia bacterium]|nr:NADH-quinone oxidoreductase subunit L [Coriobacteriia bacterium]